MEPEPITHLRRGGTSVVVSLTDSRLPRILYWGSDLGDLDTAELHALELATQPTIGDSAVTYPQPVPVLPQLHEGWMGAPGLAGERDGAAWAPVFSVVSATPTDEPGQAATMTVQATDDVSELELDIELRLEPGGVLALRARVRNLGDSYRLNRLELAVPVPDQAQELIDQTGRWSLERVPQRHPFPVGRWERESRGGKPGFNSPMVLLAGEPGFGFRGGEVWGVHVAWSGNQVLAAECTPAGTRLLRAGELFLPGEVVLERGQEYVSPWMACSRGVGIDDLAARYHHYVRARASHPTTVRPVLVNTWEAVYFDHDPKRMATLAQRSADMGAERFVVDDGWFTGRHNDRSSLGDWTVDPDKWPDGLERLATRVRELGMEFGLWFEPEMVNLDSDLAREHPEWVFDAGHGPGMPSRYQHVLDLGHEDAYVFVRDRIDTLVKRLGIAYIKWDHNRFLTDAGHGPTGKAGVRVQTQQAYRMMSELRAANPGLEIESCASGGGRVDLGVLSHTDRVWVSDCNDPHDRLDMHRWTSVLLPPELQGAHIGAARAHTTGRISSLAFRAATALWGHLGLELDLTALDDAEFAELQAWVQLHKDLRPLLHSGSVVHADTQPEVRLDGVVAADRATAVYHYAVVGRPVTWPPHRMRLPGLDPDRRYRVTEYEGFGADYPGQRPPWLAGGGVVLSGKVLSAHGLEAPSLAPDTSIIFSAVVAEEQ